MDTLWQVVSKQELPTPIHDELGLARIVRRTQWFKSEAEARRHADSLKISGQEIVRIASYNVDIVLLDTENQVQ